jgi:hypothetical protein
MVRQAFGEESMSRAKVLEQHARFRAGRTSGEEDEHTGRPISSTTPNFNSSFLRINVEPSMKVIMGHDNGF